jgi:hypothetical protein
MHATSDERMPAGAPRPLARGGVMVKSGLVVLIVAVALATTALAQEPPCPESLVVAAGTSDFECRVVGDLHEITYQVRAPYPAAKVIEAVQAELRTKGWLPLADDPLNPGIRSSHVEGWSSFEDDSVKPHCTVYRWMADWVNLDGDILRFAFSYRSAGGEVEDLDELHVVGTFTPSKIARQELEKKLGQGRRKP